MMRDNLSGDKKRKNDIIFSLFYGKPFEYGNFWIYDRLISN